MPRAPCFELFSRFVRVAVHGHHRVNVIRSTVDDVQLPAANPAMIRNGVFHEQALLQIKERNNLLSFELPLLVSESDREVESHRRAPPSRVHRPATRFHKWSR